MHLASANATARQPRASPAILACTTGPLSFPSTDDPRQSTTEAPAHHQVMTCKKNKWSVVNLKKISIYLQVLFPGEPNVSGKSFVDFHFFDASLVVYDGLDARLVKHICHQLVTSSVSHLHRPEHYSFLASVEIQHINMNKVIISRMSN
jgi:hypothetical protein